MAAAAIELRDYQGEAVERTRDLIRQGYRRILICAPTGAGKTRIGAYLVHACSAKGQRSRFIVDRISLIEQTSRTYYDHGIEHGVIQGGHWNFHPERLAQVCSVQTLQRRKPVESRLTIVDEAHSLNKFTQAMLASETGIFIGLSATPFTKGLGKHYDAIVNVTTTNKLIEDGWLVPYRVFACHEADMSDVRVVAGEWEEAGAEKAALEVVGDVVAEYLKHGEGRKFICSAVNTDHCTALYNQFIAAGINVETYTYRDGDDERADTLKEFTKNDSAIRGLITVSAASKGFDCPSVSCIIMARPLRSSLAEHIQLLGRGLRISPETGKKDCVARGTLVLTDRGEVPIEHLTLDHKVWDGEQFVAHAGALCQGVRKVIEYDGLIATPDHEVMTNDGWARFEEAARRQLRIARTGSAGHPVRLADDRFSSDAGQRPQPARRGGVLSLLASAFRAVSQHPQASRHGGLPALQCAAAGAGAAMAVPAMPGANGSLLQSEFPLVRALWRAWDRVSIRLGQRSGALDRGESRRAGSVAAAGSQGQRRALRAGQSALGDGRGEHEQHPGLRWARAIHRLSAGISGGALRGRDADPAAAHADARGDRGALEAGLVQAEREVWDVLNAGPLQRFTANGRLVHNCIVLDHTGNVMRFWTQMQEFFDSGWSVLDDGKKKEKPKLDQREEAQPVKCPSCGRVHKFRPSCPQCGHVYPKKSQAIEHKAGTLKELIAAKDRKSLSADLWPQVASHARARRPGDAEAAKKMALALYKDMTGTWPLRDFEHTPDAPITPEVASRIRAQQIRYAHRMAKRPAAAGAPA